MKNNMLIRISVLVCLSVMIFSISCKEESNDKGTIDGIITDSQTSQAINGATVTISPSNSSAVTGSDGKYQFPDLTEGDYTISVSKTGYSDNTKQVTVLGGQVRKGDISLTPVVAILTVNMTSLDFGTSYTVLPIEIRNTGSNSLEWEVSENVAWMSINPISGTTTTEVDAIEITIDRNQMGSGQFSQVFSITSNGGNATITVNVEVPVNSVPSVTCNQPTNLSQTSADISGSISSIGNSTVIERGHCWSTSPNPTTANSKTTLGGTTTPGQFASNLTALEPDQVYYVRAYATNSIGTGYSNQVTFTTSSASSVIVTNGLIAYYTFDNQNANDWTGNYNGIMQGAEISNDIPNSSGYSISFMNSEAAQFITATNPIKNFSQVSFNLWFKCTTKGVIFSAGQTWSQSFNLRFTETTVGFNMAQQYSGSYFQTNISTVFDNQWHMLTVTCGTSSTGSKLYIDGVLYATHTDGLSQGTTTLEGGYFGGNGTNYFPGFNGQLDNFRIYNRILTQSEITQIYNLQQ